MKRVNASYDAIASEHPSDIAMRDLTQIEGDYTDLLRSIQVFVTYQISIGLYLNIH